MSGYLGNRKAAGVVSNGGVNPFGDGFWAVTFDAATLAMGSNDFEIYHLALTGPGKSNMRMFIDSTFYDLTPPLAGDINSWEGNHPIFMRGGQEFICYWDTAAAPAPKVTIYLQVPSR